MAPEERVFPVLVLSLFSTAPSASLLGFYNLAFLRGVRTPSTYNARVVALRFFFSMTCGREEMKRFMQFCREPRKLSIVLIIEKISALLASAPGPRLKYRAALSIGYGGGLRASEVTHLKVRDIDSDRMLIHVERSKGGKDRDVMLSPSLLDLLGNYWREARPQGWLFPGQSRVDPISSRQLNRAFTSAKRPLGRLLCNRLPGNAWPGSKSPQHCTRCDTAFGGEHGCWRNSGLAQAFQAQHDGAIHPCCNQNAVRCRQRV
jgi:integrase